MTGCTNMDTLSSCLRPLLKKAGSVAPHTKQPTGHDMSDVPQAGEGTGDTMMQYFP